MNLREAMNNLEVENIKPKKVMSCADFMKEVLDIDIDDELEELEETPTIFIENLTINLNLK